MPWTLRMTLLVTGITTICFIYNTARIYWYSKQTGFHHFRIFWAVFGGSAILIFAYPLSGWLLLVATGDFSREWYPLWMIVLFWYGFIFNAVLLSWILAVDLINLIVTYLVKVRRPQLQTMMGLGVLFITASVFVYTAAKTMYDTSRITIEQIQVEHPAVESGEIRPIRMVHISEIHADLYTSQKKIARYMRRVAEQKPDIIFFTGDLISSGRDYLESAATALGSVDPPLGVYFVLGDHDYWAGGDEVTDVLQRKGINVIRDANEWISYGNGTIKITGITEVYSASVDCRVFRELLNEKRDEQLSILFSHQATDHVIEIAQESGTDILLAGHTHGGQIRIPVFFNMLTAASGETDYVIGHWWLGDMLLNINSGLGFTLGPLRYNAPAEVSVINVR